MESTAGPITSVSRTSAEIAAGVTPVNLQYAPPDLRRYGALTDGSNPGNINSTAIQNALAVAVAGVNQGYILHPGGTIAHSSTILFGTKCSVVGVDRAACIFSYTGVGSAWRSTNTGTTTPTANASGDGLVRFTGVKITTASASNLGAAIELNAGAFAFYEIDNCWLQGTFKYGIILDGTNVSHVHHNVVSVNDGTAVAGKSACIWVISGPDRTAGQGNSTNVLTINDNQLDIGNGGVCLVDDGGANHHYHNNNLNGGAGGARLAGLATFSFIGQDMENAGVANLTFNLMLADTRYVSGTFVGPCLNGTIEHNNFGMDMASGGSEITTAGSTTMHRGIGIRDNHFRFNSGRTGGAIDVTQLGNSVCENNIDDAHQNSVHYFGLHNDNYGNRLSPPSAAALWRASTAYSAAAGGEVVLNGTNFYVCTTGGTSAASGGPTGQGAGIADGSCVWNFTTQTTSVGFSQAAQIMGDKRYVNQFTGGVDAKSSGAASLQIDAQKWQNFVIQIINSAGTLNHAIEDTFITGATSAYVDRITGATASLNVLPLNLDTTHGFVAGAGLLAADNSVLILNTAGQVLANSNFSAFVSTYDGNVTRTRVKYGLVSRNINGTTAIRPEIRLIDDMTGAAVVFNATLLPANKSMVITFCGYLL